jgi:hypothetical protein
MLTWKMARTVTGSVAEMRAPKVMHSKKGREYEKPQSPDSHLQGKDTLNLQLLQSLTVQTLRRFDTSLQGSFDGVF